MQFDAERGENVQAEQHTIGTDGSQDVPERIIRAAIKYRDGHVIHVPIPGRHHTCFRRAETEGRKPNEADEQGFLTSSGRFVARVEAWRIAVAANQLLPIAPTDGRGGTLYSEDVW